MAFFFVSVILSQSLQDVGTDAGGVLIAASLKTGRSRTQNLRPAAWNKGKERKKESKKEKKEKTKLDCCCMQAEAGSEP